MSSPTTSKELNLANFVAFNYKGEYETSDIKIPDNIYVLMPQISGVSGVSGYVGEIDFRKIYEGKTPIFTTASITPPSPSTTASITPPSPSTASITPPPPSEINQWKLYVPREYIKNIKINSETNCADVGENNKIIMAGDTGNNFIIYADSDKSHDPIEIGDESAFTVKICKDTNLQDIFVLLTEAQKRNNELKSPKIKTPIILVPFISNDSPDMNIEKFEDISILNVFDTLYTNSYGGNLPKTEYIESPSKSLQVKPELLTPLGINENVEEFKKKLKTIIDEHKDVEKLQIFNEKTNKFPIKVKTYANSDFIIFKLVGDEFHEIDINNPEENAVGNAILTFFKYSKTSISYNNTKATIKCSLTYKKNDVPLYLKVGKDSYKLRKRK